jgi:hypothetical protein
MAAVARSRSGNRAIRGRGKRKALESARQVISDNNPLNDACQCQVRCLHEKNVEIFFAKAPKIFMIR